MLVSFKRRVLRALLEKRLREILCLLVILTASLGLLDRFLGLRSPLLSMKPNKALGFIAAGVAVCVLRRGVVWPLVLSRVLAPVVGLLGLLTLVEHIFNCDLALDHLFFAAQSGGLDPRADRMTLTTALNFCLIGIALPLLGSSRPRLLAAAEVVVLVQGFNSLLPLMSFAYRTSPAAHSSMDGQMTLKSSVLFMLVCWSLFLALPGWGFTGRLIRGRTLGGSLARRLVPAAFVIPFLAGLIRLEGERTGLFSGELGLSIMVLFTFALFVCLIGSTSWSLDRMDRERRQAGEALGESRELSRLVIERAYDAFVSIDSRGLITEWNPQAEIVFGWSREEALGRSLAETIIPPQFREAHHRGLERFLRTGEGEVLNRRIETLALHRAGHLLSVELTISPIRFGQDYFFSAFIHDITRRKHIEDELRLSNARLEAANKELQEFSYSLSHDLKAPLRSLDGFSHALLEDFGDKLGDEGKDFLMRIGASSRRMAQLIEGMLELFRITKREISMTSVDLSEVAAAVMGDLQQTQPQRQVDVRIEKGLVARGDPALLRSAMENLLGNAWKFTKHASPARIEFGSTSHEGKPVFFVRDNGVGFDMAYSKRLFGVFRRLHDNSEFPGTGIGLASVKMVVQRHGGRVWAEGATGQGATFYFTLDENSREKAELPPQFKQGGTRDDAAVPVSGAPVETVP